MILDVDEDSLKQGVLGLVVAVVEIIRDALRSQALKRVEAGSLTEEECERLGSALQKLDAAIDSIKREQALEDVVQSVRDGLDDAVDEILQSFIDPSRWVAANQRDEGVKQRRL